MSFRHHPRVLWRFALATTVVVLAVAAVAAPGIAAAGPGPPSLRSGQPAGLSPGGTAVSLTFDDGLASQARLRPTFAAHHVHGTFYVNTHKVDTHGAGLMTWPMIHGLVHDGTDVGGHTLDHVDLASRTVPTATKWREVCADRARLVQQGLNPVSFAYPYAEITPQAERIVRGCGYLSGRSGGSLSASGPVYTETVPPRDPMAVWALGETYDGPIALHALQAAVNAAADHGGGWLPLIFHAVCYQGTADYRSCMAGYRPVDSRVVDAFLGWLARQKGRGIRVLDMAEVMGGGRPSPAVTVTRPAPDTVVTGRGAIAGLRASGTAAPTGSAVSVSVYRGSYAAGPPSAVLTARNRNGSWTTSPARGLPRGVYTLQASQTRAGVPGHSVPSTVRLGTATPAPNVAIHGPATGALVNLASPVISGSAGIAPGDVGSVRVNVFPGTSAVFARHRSLTARVGPDGNWSVPAGTLPDGVYTTQAEQPGISGASGWSAPVTFTVHSSTAVRSGSPDRLAQGVSGKTVMVTGSGFTAQSNVTFSGVGITGQLISLQNPMSMRVSVSVAPGATLGRRDLLVVNPGQPDATCHGCLSVSAGPRPTTVAPGTLRQGALSRVEIHGSGFAPGAQVTAGGGGVTTTVVATTRTTITLQVAVAGNATPAPRDLKVTNPDGGTGTSVGGLLILPVPEANPASGSGP